MDTICLSLCIDSSVTMRGVPLAEVNAGLESIRQRFLNMPELERQQVRAAVVRFDDTCGERVLHCTKVADLDAHEIPAVAIVAPTGKEGRPDLSAGIDLLVNDLEQLEKTEKESEFRHLVAIVLHNPPKSETFRSAVRRAGTFQHERLGEQANEGRRHSTYAALFLVGETISPDDVLDRDGSSVFTPTSLVRFGIVARLRGLMFRECFSWLADQVPTMINPGVAPLNPLLGNMWSWCRDIYRVS